MRRLGVIFLALSSIGVGWLGSGCGDNDRMRHVDGIAFSGPEGIDFGRVGLGATVKKAVTVRNGGRAPLVLEDFSIDDSDGIFAVHNLGSSLLMEAQRTTLQVEFAPEEEGERERTLSIRTDDPAHRLIEIPLRGTGVRPRVVATPDALDFGIVELGVPITLPLRLENGFDITVQVQLGRDGDAQFSFKPAGSVGVDPNSTLELAVTFLPTRVGKADGEISIIPCPICDEVRVPMTGVGINQALVVKPSTVDFGFVPVERTARRRIEITNVSSYPIDIHSMKAAVGRPAFTFTGFVGTVDPGETVTVEIDFGPTQTDLDEDWIEIDSTSVRAPLIRVHILGRGGGPQIQVTPASLDFGSVPLGARGQRDLIITNAGTDVGAPPLQILEIRVENPVTDLFGADRDLLVNPVSLLAGGVATIKIGYEPTQVTSGVGDQAVLVVVSNDQTNPEIRIPMRGSAFSAPPCNVLVIAPPQIDFGSFDVGWGGVLSIQIFNPGTEMCILRNLRIAAGSDPAFTTWPVESFLIEGGHWFGWMVAFDPHAVGAGGGYYRGELEFFVVNGSQQRYAIPLVAGSEDGCLKATPNFLDFGTEQTGCGEKDRSVHIANLCPFEVGVGGVSLGAQSSPGEFEIVRQPTTPLRLGPGQGFDVGVRWKTELRGINSAPLFVIDDSRSLPLTVPILGELLQDGIQVDRFIQQKPSTTDVLIVVDNSSSMVEEQPRVKAAAHVLIDEAERLGIDFHIGVTSTGASEGSTQFVCPGGVNGNEAGRLFPLDVARPRIITAATPGSRTVLAENTQVGYCQELEQGLEAMRLALSEPLASNENRDFLRSDAGLAVIFISDEDDHSGYRVQSYDQFLVALKGLGGAVVSAIVDTGEVCAEGAGVGERYLDLSRTSGGVAASLCAKDWTPLLRRIAARSFQAQGPFVLSARPDAAGVMVSVDGTPAPTASWRYDSASNSISFVKGSEPRPGAVIEVRFEADCG